MCFHTYTSILKKGRRGERDDIGTSLGKRVFIVFPESCIAFNGIYVSLEQTSFRNLGLVIHFDWVIFHLFSSKLSLKFVYISWNFFAPPVLSLCVSPQKSMQAILLRLICAHSIFVAHRKSLHTKMPRTTTSVCQLITVFKRIESFFPSINSMLDSFRSSSPHSQNF